MPAMTTPPRPRARDLGLPLSGVPGPLNAITDVPGVQVGLCTIREEQPRPGRRLPVRTGVTAILPRPIGDAPRPVHAGIHRFNGNGEITGSHWIEDGGLFAGPVLITNTHSVGIAHHAAIRWMIERHPATYEGDDLLWILPVVAETFDGLLNDINGQHVTEADVRAALDGAAPGPVAEGSTGGGTGMIAYGFKGGTGTASRRVAVAGREFTLGVLVQANHGQRDWLTVCGLRVGGHLKAATREPARERGSIIAVVATDIPMAPHQLKRVARRCAIGIGRGGTPGGNNSGDIFLAFSTANEGPLPHRRPPIETLEVLSDELFDPVYMAVVEGVEEAVLNAMLAAETTGGTAHDRFLVRALEPDALLQAMSRAQRTSIRKR